MQDSAIHEFSLICAVFLFNFFPGFEFHAVITYEPQIFLVVSVSTRVLEVTLKS